MVVEVLCFSHTICVCCASHHLGRWNI